MPTKADFQWWKERAELLRGTQDQVDALFQQTHQAYEPGPWAIMKLALLGYYIQVYTNILGSSGTTNYVDLFAGPGIDKIRGTQYKIMGSPLLAEFAPKRNKFSFSESPADAMSDTKISRAFSGGVPTNTKMLDTASLDMHELFRAWRSISLERPPYIFPGDEECLLGHSVCFRSFEEFSLSASLCSSDGKLHVGLRPVPYIGDLQNSAVYILTANPGLHPIDYYSEERDVDYQDALRTNLLQECQKSTHPFFFLDPRFSWHSGFAYWYARLRVLARTPIGSLESSDAYCSALTNLAKSVSVLELVPYHSASFNPKVVRHLHSTRVIGQYAKEELLKRALAEKALLVVLRAYKHWKEFMQLRVEEPYVVRSCRRNGYLSEEASDRIREFLRERQLI